MHPFISNNSFVPNANNMRRLRDAFGQFATGVTIVTAQSDDGPVGITANSFSSVSLAPAMVLWCADKSSKRYNIFARAESYAIHVLSADQADLCWNIAGNGFALEDMGLATNAEGVPVIENCLARFECRRSAAHDAGDHAIIVGDILRVSYADSGQALTFFQGQVREFK